MDITLLVLNAWVTRRSCFETVASRHVTRGLTLTSSHISEDLNSECWLAVSRLTQAWQYAASVSKVKTKAEAAFWGTFAMMRDLCVSAPTDSWRQRRENVSLLLLLNGWTCSVLTSWKKSSIVTAEALTCEAGGSELSIQEHKRPSRINVSA